MRLLFTTRFCFLPPRNGGKFLFLGSPRDGNWLKSGIVLVSETNDKLDGLRISSPYSELDTGLKSKLDSVS